MGAFGCFILGFSIGFILGVGFLGAIWIHCAEGLTDD